MLYIVLPVNDLEFGCVCLPLYAVTVYCIHCMLQSVSSSGVSLCNEGVHL